MVTHGHAQVSSPDTHAGTRAGREPLIPPTSKLGPLYGAPRLWGPLLAEPPTASKPIRPLASSGVRGPASRALRPRPAPRHCA